MDSHLVHSRSRPSPLPSWSNAVEEKQYLTRRSSPLFTSLYIPIPNTRRRIVIPLPIPPSLWMWPSAKDGRKKASVAAWIIPAMTALLVLTLIRVIFVRRDWSVLSIVDPPTLVYGREDLQRIWQWEIGSGHYPSTRAIPKEIRLVVPPHNPGIPPSSYQRSVGQPKVPSTIGVGSKRDYINIEAQPPNIAYPPRVPAGSVADLDVIMDHCDFATGKYVRDCLEILRLGAGLDAGRRLRRGNVDIWKYIFKEGSARGRDPPPQKTPLSLKQQQMIKQGMDDSGLRRRNVLEAPLANLSSPVVPTPFPDLQDGPCDPDYPKIFHMFWAGPFNEKPYVALLSFLFTQNLGLHLEEPGPSVCRPEFWLWINPSPAAAVPDPNALGDMFRDLEESPWAAPFLHPRFKEVIKFKMWNTTEQLDGVPELKDEWRLHQESLLNSGGTKFKTPGKGKGKKVVEESALTTSTSSSSDVPPGLNHATVSSSSVPEAALPATTQNADDDLFDRLGSTSSSAQDRLSVVLSDMARFILCHRFGGIYLDADTVFLRDWEELWGWKGAFAYRWSYHLTYNTAVLHLNKGSALGTFLFRTAFRNGFDFHPMTIGKYTKEAYLEGLLLRLPDAMFDPDWLAWEGHQLDRPAFPLFPDFEHFFRPPAREAAAPQMLGFDGFFKGAYSYHFHNFWWVPFDSSRNFPDLGPKFKNGEFKARQKLKAEAAVEAAKLTGKPDAIKQAIAAARERKMRVPTKEEIREMEQEDEDVMNDARDMAWSAVLKRTFEAYVRGERPNMYGEWLKW